jgi:hypothetical protein
MESTFTPPMRSSSSTQNRLSARAARCSALELGAACRRSVRRPTQHAERRDNLWQQHVRARECAARLQTAAHIAQQLLLARKVVSAVDGNAHVERGAMQQRLQHAARVAAGDMNITRACNGGWHVADALQRRLVLQRCDERKEEEARRVRGGLDECPAITCLSSGVQALIFCTWYSRAHSCS